MDLANLRIIYSSEGLAAINAEMNQARGNAEKNFGAISRAAGTAMTAVGAAITGALGLAVKSALAFDTGMREVGTLGVENMDKLREGVLDYSVTMGKDAVESTRDLYAILSKGIPEASALSVLESSAKAGAAGVGEVSDALSLGTSIINAYDLEVADFESIMGQAVIAVKNGATTIGEMGDVMGRVAPLASEAGISVGELMSAVAGITATGTKTSEAISGLKAAITNIISPSESATAIAKAMKLEFSATALKAQGLDGFLSNLRDTIESQGPVLAKNKDLLAAQIKTMEETSGGTKGLSKEINELKKKYKGMGDVSENTLTTMAAMLGSVEALNTVLGLTAGKGQAAFRKSLEETQQGAEALNKTYEEWAENNPALAFAQAKAEVQALGIRIGGILLPALRDLLKSLMPIIQSVSEWIQKNPPLAATIVKIIAAIGAFNLALGPILFKLPTIIGLFKSLVAIKAGAGLTQAAAGATQLAGAAGQATGAVGGLGGGLTGATAGAGALALKLGALGLVIGATSVALKLFWDQHKGLVADVDNLILSKERLTGQIAAYATQLEAAGIEVDRVALKEMTREEQIAHLNELDKTRGDTALMEKLQRFGTEEEARNRLAAAKSLLINQEITEEEAAQLAMMDLKDRQIDALMRADAEATQSALEFAGIRAQGQIESSQQSQAAVESSTQAQKQAAESGAQAMTQSMGKVAKSAETTGKSFEGFGKTTEKSWGLVAKKAKDGSGDIQVSFDGIDMSVKGASESVEQSAGQIEGGVQTMEGAFNQLPNTVDSAMQSTVSSVRSGVDGIVSEMERAREAMHMLDPNEPFSPSIVELVERGMKDTVSLFRAGFMKIGTDAAMMRATLNSELADELEAVAPTIAGTFKASSTPQEAQGAVADSVAALAPASAPLLGGPGATAFAGNKVGGTDAPAAGPITVVMENVTIASDMDIDEIARKMARSYERELSLVGLQ